MLGGGGGGGDREKLRGIPICFRRITFITPGKPIPRTEHVTWKHWFLKKCCKQNLKCRKIRMSALNYEFLVQPTRMEGKNSYCVVKCVIKCVINVTMQSLCVSTFVTVVEVLRDYRKKLSLLWGISISLISVKSDCCIFHFWTHLFLISRS